jgi:hypothetical protein
MHDFAVEQIGHCRQTDMRVGTDIDALTGGEITRPHPVKEDERPDHAVLGVGQHPGDLKPAEIAGARFDNEGNGGRHIGAHRVGALVCQ